MTKLSAIDNFEGDGIKMTVMESLSSKTSLVEANFER